jgi:hypothetical protein
MRAREVAGVIAALLLPLPVVLLVLGAKYPGLWVPKPAETHLSPVLGFEEKMRRQTYRRDCQRSSECEPPLGCLDDIRARTAYCTDSQCTQDSECAEDEQCRAVATVGGGPLVRLCIPAGLRKEGEQCWQVPTDKESACEKALLCGGDGWCARPCQKQDAASCPEGFFCADVAPEPVCLPTCQGRPCPEGLRCVRFNDGVSSCARVYGPPCQEDASCAECAISSFPRYPGEVWMQCVQRCGQGRPPCPEGSACKIQRCLPRCDRKAPDSCAEGFFCARPGPEYPSVCAPEWMRRG